MCSSTPATLCLGACVRIPEIKSIDVSMEVGIIETKLKDCAPNPTPTCRDEFLRRAVSHYELEFIKVKGKVLGSDRFGKAENLTEGVAQVGLTALSGDREREGIPLGLSLMNVVGNVFYSRSAKQVKIASMESDILRLKLRIEDHYGESLDEYSLEQARVDVRRLELAAAGSEYE